MSRRKARYAISQAALRSAIAKARACAKEGGREIVGLLVDNGFCLELVTCRNRSRKGGSFSFFAKEVRSIVAAAKLLGHKIVGTFHSHPVGPAEPGERDVRYAVDHSLMLVIACLGSEAGLWHIKGGRAWRLPFEILGTQPIN